MSHCYQHQQLSTQNAAATRGVLFGVKGFTLWRRKISAHPMKKKKENSKTGEWFRMSQTHLGTVGT